ncbi:MAG: radical SAM protein, partial [Synergistaceae bacterium]|nr:radical SAM protein [Synergistaceae bacterium]
MRAIIIDGYVDEPACFGVPPYVSPYVRYCAGALYANGWDVDYATCDRWRSAKDEYTERIVSFEIVLVIMGLTVPGRYRGGSPLTMRELGEIAETKSRSRGKGVLILGGPIRWGYTLRGGRRAEDLIPEGVDLIATGDVEMSLDIFCRTKEWISDARRSYEWLDGQSDFPSLGAAIVKSHPSYPNLIAEMELSRGCDRVTSTGRGCSYCAEAMSGGYAERSEDGVTREAKALDEAGIRAFRLGRAANILAYGGTKTDRGFAPNSGRLESLYSGIRGAAKNLSILHTDNCNPATIARFSEESARCLEVIVRHNTEGDGLSLGLENLDPAVREANNLKVSYDEALEAVRIINEIGASRRTPRSMPSLLPGPNFLFGLAGESGPGLAWNTKFLETLLEERLCVRRINIRRAITFSGVPLSSVLSENPSKLKERDYRRWKGWVRGVVDPIMLERVAPDGVILKDVIIESREGHVAFGGQLGSYPPLVGIVSETAVGECVDVMVTGRGGRSL